MIEPGGQGVHPQLLQIHYIQREAKTAQIAKQAASQILHVAPLDSSLIGAEMRYRVVVEVNDCFVIVLVEEGISDVDD